MKIEYNINNNDLVVNFNFLYNFRSNQNNLSNIKKYINNLIINNNINYNGNKIVVYKDRLLIGTFYLTNYYLRKLNFYKNNNLLTNNNCYFYDNKYVEITSNNKIKTKKVLAI